MLSFRVRASVWVVALATAATATIIAGPWALAYILLYAAATLPGWPIGAALFGRRHPASWIAGALLGYGVTGLVLWSVIAIGRPSAAAFLLAWAAASAAAWRLVPRGEPLVSLPAWTGRGGAALVLLLLIVPAVFVLPYRNLGARDAEGNQFYRAYFTADFIWHTALTAELAKYDMPPVNPYLGDRTIQYYWTYFLLPAAVAEEGPPGLRHVEPVLKVNALCTGLLFLSALVLVTWSASRSAAGTVLAVMVGVLAPSAEGLYAIWDLVARGRPLAGLAYVNVDAITAWEFRGLRVDGLVRSMWYNPQHSMSAALGLLALPIAGAAGAAARPGAVLVAGLALALSTSVNPLIGGLFALIYGAVIAADALQARRVALLVRHAPAAALVAAAVLWTIANDMVEGAGGVVVFGFGGYARNAPLVTLLLSLGPLLLPALLPLVAPWRIRRHAWPAVAGTALGLSVFYLVRLSVEGSYMGFRAGQLLQLSLPGLAALCFAGIWRRWPAGAVGLGAVLFAVGLPTTLIDTYNAQDIGNRAMGPGFRWTVTVTPEEQEAHAWLRRQTPPDAIVQMDPVAHGRETWSQLPTFAWRRMAAATPISLMNVPEYGERTRKVREMYETADPAAAAAIARDLGIDYVFVGPAEREAHEPDALAKFGERDDLFQLVFVNGRTRIYRVVRE